MMHTLTLNCCTSSSMSFKTQSQIQICILYTIVDQQDDRSVIKTGCKPLAAMMRAAPRKRARNVARLMCTLQGIWQSCASGGLPFTAGISPS